MRIQSLRIAQFRKFDQAVLVDGFGIGLNLIAGPNETGKSTLLLALRAALFERHNGKSDAIREFLPHKVTGARPTVTLAFEIDGKRYRLEKSFLKRPAACLETPDGRRFEGTDAEAELKRLLRLDPSEKTPINKGSPAHFGLLLTPQTQSFQQATIADGTRHSLEAAIAADIAELGNQSEVDGLLMELGDMLFDFVSKRGEPKNRYKDVTTRLDAIEQEIAEARTERDRLDEQLKLLEHAVTERRTLQAADAAENLSEHLSTLESERTQAAQRQMLENQRLAASQRLQTAETKQAARQKRQKDRQHVAAEVEAIDKTAEDARNRLGSAEQALFECEGRLADLQEQSRTVNQRRRDLEALGRQFERLSQIEATLSALATDVRLELQESALDRVTLDGERAAAASDLRQVIEGLSIEIEGIGRIGIEPKVEPMREALAAKGETESAIEQLLEALKLDDSDRETIEAAWQVANSEIESLETSRAELGASLSKEQRQVAEAKAVLGSSDGQRTRLKERLTDLDVSIGEDMAGEAALDAEIAEAKAAVEAASIALGANLPTEGRGLGQTVEELDRNIADLRDRTEKRRRAIDDANKNVLALESAIAVRSGLGLDEKIDQLERQRHLLAEERDAFALDHSALSLLQSKLREAADEAKATFNAPLSARLAPYIQALFPNATPVVTPDFSIRAIDRNSVEEPFLHLSDGTREQVAILARLAFADMLKEQRLPALIVLDDPLAFSDSERLKRMFAILDKAAKRMQVVILTCHEDRFAGLKATRLRIEPATEAASSAA